MAYFSTKALITSALSLSIPLFSGFSASASEPLQPHECREIRGAADVVVGEHVSSDDLNPHAPQMPFVPGRARDGRTAFAALSYGSSILHGEWEGKEPPPQLIKAFFNRPLMSASVCDSFLNSPRRTTNVQEKAPVDANRKAEPPGRFQISLPVLTAEKRGALMLLRRTGNGLSASAELVYLVKRNGKWAQTGRRTLFIS